MPKSIDELDKKIISSLSKDCRKSTTQIAKEAGTSRPTIIARMKQLSESQIIDFKAKINLKKLGLKFATIHFRVEKAQESKAVIEKLKLIYVEDAETLLSSIDCLESFLGIKILMYQRVLPLIGESFDIDISLEKCEKTPCGKECGLCLSYQHVECAGCPTTSKSRGPI